MWQKDWLIFLQDKSTAGNILGTFPCEQDFKSIKNKVMISFQLQRKTIFIRYP